MRKSGIYVIRNLITHKVYVGSSVNLTRRIRNHHADLMAGSHFNEHLQRAWQKHGSGNFAFEIVEECEPSCRIVREQSWISDLQASNPEHGYNVMHTVRGVVPSPRRSKISKDMWNDPAFVSNIKTKRALTAKDPAFVEKERASAKALWATDEHRQKMRRRDEALKRNDGFKAKRRDLAKAQWENPSSRAKGVAAAVQQWSDPEAREKLLEAQQQGRREKDFSGTMRRVVSDQWKDPAFREARVAALKLGQAKRRARLLEERTRNEIVSAMVKNEAIEALDKEPA